MSATVPVHALGRDIWAYDVSLAILLKLLADEVEANNAAPWTPEEIEGWRIHALLGANCAFNIGDGWSRGKLDDFVRRMTAICAHLETRADFDWCEIKAWRVLSEEFPWRGDANARLATAAVASLGRALVALVLRELPADPPNATWFYGVGSEPTALARRS